MIGERGDREDREKVLEMDVGCAGQNAGLFG